MSKITSSRLAKDFSKLADSINETLNLLDEDYNFLVNNLVADPRSPEVVLEEEKSSIEDDELHVIQEEIISIIDSFEDYLSSKEAKTELSPRTQRVIRDQDHLDEINDLRILDEIHNELADFVLERYSDQYDLDPDIKDLVQEVVGEINSPVNRERLKTAVKSEELPKDLRRAVLESRSNPVALLNYFGSKKETSVMEAEASILEDFVGKVSGDVTKTKKDSVESAKKDFDKLKTLVNNNRDAIESWLKERNEGFDPKKIDVLLKTFENALTSGEEVDSVRESINYAYVRFQKILEASGGVVIDMKLNLSPEATKNLEEMDVILKDISGLPFGKDLKGEFPKPFGNKTPNELVKFTKDFLAKIKDAQQNKLKEKLLENALKQLKAFQVSIINRNNSYKFLQDFIEKAEEYELPPENKVKEHTVEELLSEGENLLKMLKEANVTPNSLGTGPEKLIEDNSDILDELHTLSNSEIPVEFIYGKAEKVQSILARSKPVLAIFKTKIMQSDSLVDFGNSLLKDQITTYLKGLDEEGMEENKEIQTAKNHISSLIKSFSAVNKSVEILSKNMDLNKGILRPERFKFIIEFYKNLIENSNDKIIINSIDFKKTFAAQLVKAILSMEEAVNSLYKLVQENSAVLNFKTKVGKKEVLRFFQDTNVPTKTLSDLVKAFKEIPDQFKAVYSLLFADVIMDSIYEDGRRAFGSGVSEVLIPVDFVNKKASMKGMVNKREFQMGIRERIGTLSKKKVKVKQQGQPDEEAQIMEYFIIPLNKLAGGFGDYPSMT